MSAPTHYTGSDGKRHEIVAMDYHHLMNARKKLEGSPIIGGDATANQRMKEIGARNALIAAMKAEEARRNLAYADEAATKPTPELQRAWAEMNAPNRRAAPDWTPERQAVYDAVQAELKRRGL